VREADAAGERRLRDAALDLRGQAEQGQRRLELAATGPARPGVGLARPGRHPAAQIQDASITPGPWRMQLQRPVDWRAAGGNFESLPARRAARAGHAQRRAGQRRRARLDAGAAPGRMLTTAGG
jgi:hypothetical protein